MMSFTVKIIGSSLLVATITGCVSTPSRVVCPTYPTPSQDVLNAVLGLNNGTVDYWMLKQYRLSKKLKACNGK